MIYRTNELWPRLVHQLACHGCSSTATEGIVHASSCDASEPGRLVMMRRACQARMTTSPDMLLTGCDRRWISNPRYKTRNIKSYSYYRHKLSSCCSPFPSPIGTGYHPPSFFSTQPSSSYLNKIWNNVCLYCCCHFKPRCWDGTVCRAPAPCRYEVCPSIVASAMTKFILCCIADLRVPV